MSTTIYSANSLFHDSDGYYHLIYMIVNKINNKIYIGKHTTKNPYDDYMGSGKSLKAAIQKHGKHNFEKIILFSLFTENEAFLKEAEIVTPEFINRKDTYNLKCGGKGNFSFDIQGKKHPMYGKKHSSKTKKKLSDAHKGKQFSEEHKKKIASAMKRRVFSEETRKKLSEHHANNTGKNHPGAKIIQKINLDGSIIKEYDCIKDCCKEENISRTSLYLYLKYKRPHKAFYFIYKII